MFLPSTPFYGISQGMTEPETSFATRVLKPVGLAPLMGHGELWSKKVSRMRSLIFSLIFIIMVLEMDEAWKVYWKRKSCVFNNKWNPYGEFHRPEFNGLVGISLERSSTVWRSWNGEFWSGVLMSYDVFHGRSWRRMAGNTGIIVRLVEIKTRNEASGDKQYAKAYWKWSKLWRSSWSERKYLVRINLESLVDRLSSLTTKMLGELNEACDVVCVHDLEGK